MHKNTYSTILERFPAKFSAKVILIHICKINFRGCEMMLSTWEKFGDKKLINSSVLFNRPLMFWWYTIKIFVLFEFDRGSLLAWGCHFKQLGFWFMNFCLSFCILSSSQYNLTIFCLLYCCRFYYSNGRNCFSLL
jgi:hypothetical protein